jgi:hypothetical protein
MEQLPIATSLAVGTGLPIVRISLQIFQSGASASNTTMQAMETHPARKQDSKAHIKPNLCVNRFIALLLTDKATCFVDYKRLK